MMYKCFISLSTLPPPSQVNTSLQELHLSKHAITDTGVEWICRHLRDNSSLTHLDISW